MRDFIERVEIFSKGHEDSVEHAEDLVDEYFPDLTRAESYKSFRKYVRQRLLSNEGRMFRVYCKTAKVFTGMFAAADAGIQVAPASSLANRVEVRGKERKYKMPALEVLLGDFFDGGSRDMFRRAAILCSSGVGQKRFARTNVEGLRSVKHPVNCSTKLQTFILMALCLIHLGCKEARDEMAIRSGKTRYENWLIAQKPFLTNVPPAAKYEYEFTTIREGSTVRPIVDYYLKAGDWDGLLNLTFVIEIDAQKRPVRLREQRITFIALPAKAVVKAEGGRNRTQYCGLKLKPSEMEAVVTRAIGGGDFDDLRKQSEQGNQVVVSQFEDTDDWIKLRSR